MTIGPSVERGLDRRRARRRDDDVGGRQHVVGGAVDDGERHASAPELVERREERVVERWRARDDELRARHVRGRSRGAAATDPAACGRSSFGRLPGSRATTGRSGVQAQRRGATSRG